MMTGLTADPTPLCEFIQPHVYVRTLGMFEVEVGGTPAEWKSRTTGSQQLRRMVMHLVARCDHAVRKNDLREIARRRSEKSLSHVIPAVLALLKQWDMADALVVSPHSIILRRRHTVWCADTDWLNWHRQEAARLQAVGTPAQALRAFEQAAALCGGAYMPDYDALPEYALTDQQDRWQEIQKQVLFDWARLLGTQPEPRQCDLILSAIARAVQIDHRNPPTCRAAAMLARHCGNEARARFYDLLAGDTYAQLPQSN